MKKSLYINIFLLTLGMLFAYGNSYANYDYVCSYKVGKCENYSNNCWWNHGEKYCQGTRRDYTTIGNTRVGCPSSAKSSSTTNFNNTANSSLYINNSFYFGTISGVWNWNSVNGGSTAGIGQAVKSNLSQDFDVNDKNNIYNSTNNIYGTQTVTCVVKMGGDTAAPNISTNINLSDTTANPIDTSCYDGHEHSINSSLIITQPTDSIIGTYSGSTSINTCYRKFSSSIYQKSTSVNVNDGKAVVTITCTDGDSGCVPGFEVNGISKTGTTYEIPSTGTYTFKVYDLAGNYSYKKYDFNLNSDLSYDYTYKNGSSVVVASSSGVGDVLDKNGNWISDKIQCYLADKVSSCDNTDTYEPDGKVKFNGIDGFYSGGDWQVNMCTNSSVLVQAICTNDTAPSGIAPSGCKAGFTDNIQDFQTLTNNYENDFGIIDNAGNLLIMNYNVNVIDHILPTYINSHVSNGLAGNNGISFSVSDEAPVGCIPVNSISYSVKVGLPNNSEKTFTGILNGISNGVPVNHYEPFNFTIAGTYLVKSLTITDKAGNSSVKDLNQTINIFANEPSSTNTILSLDISNSSNSKYAIENDSYIYSLILNDQYGNPIKNKEISIEHIGDTIYSEYDSTGDIVLFIPSSDTVLTTDNSGGIKFHIKSYAPGKFLESFKFTMSKWDVDNNATTGDYVINKTTGDYNYFKKPFKGNLSIINANNKLEVGTTLTMQLSVSSSFSSAPVYTIANFAGSLSSDLNSFGKITLTGSSISLHEFQNPSSSITNPNSNPTVSFRINASTNEGASIAPSISFTSNPVISYTLGGKSVEYYINDSNEWTNNKLLDMISSGVNQYGLTIVGQSKTSGKASLTNQAENFMDYGISSYRSVIRKNSAILTKGMTNGQLVNGVKYIVGDKKISDITDLANIETLVIKDGNLIINQNITNTKLGIIVLKDNYVVDSGYTGKGNILVLPNVTFVNAILYADGGIISADSSNNVFTVDSETRTNTLNKQLIIRGNIFTRNTIGGAIKGSTGLYKLPGGSTTTDFDKAMIYDLNYIRRSNSGWNVSPNSNYNKGDKSNFIILPNSGLTNNMPKGFEL